MPASGGMNLGEEAEEDSAQMNNLIELGFLKIFYLMCLTKKKKIEVGILVGINKT
jgi:hypothetical protein